VQDIVDYPREIRITSEFQSVAKFQDKLRRQTIFHKEFDPELHDGMSQQLYEGVYIPNEKFAKENTEQDINAFVREKGNINKCRGSPRLKKSDVRF